MIDSDKSLRVTGFKRSPASDGMTRVQCRLASDGFPETLWFDVGCDDPRAIALDEPNWAAVALIYPAMLVGRDLVIEADLSPRLLHALQGDLQALLLAYDTRLQRIRVEAGATALPAAIPRSGGVATGFSAGVDSFSTVRLYSGLDVPEPLRLTHLTVHRVGSGQAARTLDNMLRRCAGFASARALKMHSALSNLDELFGAAVLPRTVFENTHSLRNAAAALLFQNGIDYFLYSSALPYASIGVMALGPKPDTAYLDPLLLPLLSTERLTLVSAGAGLSRAEKTALIADDEDAQALLDVCVRADQERLSSTGRANCSRCWKCARTMVTLDILGKLDNFHAVFDVREYRLNRTEFLRGIDELARKGSPIEAEILDLARTRGVVLPSPPIETAQWVGRKAKRFLRRLLSR